MPEVEFYEYRPNAAGHYEKMMQVVNREDDLTARITALKTLPPTMVDIVALSGDGLSVGVAGNRACVMFVQASGDPPYLWAIGKSNLVLDDVEFDVGGTPTPVPPRRVIDFSEVLAIVLFFFRFGRIPEEVAWESD